MNLLSSCDIKRYTIIEQDGVAPSDLQAMVKLSGKISAADQQQVVEIPHAIADDGLYPSRIMARLDKACRANGRRMNDGSKYLLSSEKKGEADMAGIQRFQRQEGMYMTSPSLTQHCHRRLKRERNSWRGLVSMQRHTPKHRSQF